MHGIEDVLVHGEDLQVVRAADAGHGVHEIRERHGDAVDVRDHDHGEVVLQHGLGDVEDVDAAAGAFRADFRDDADGVLADDGDDSFHGTCLSELAFDCSIRGALNSFLNRPEPVRTDLIRAPPIGDG